MKLHMFWTVPLSIISRSICSCSKSVYKTCMTYTTASVQWINSWWWTEELSETCRVSCQNKFVKLVHLKVKVIRQQAEVAQGVPDRLRPRIFLTFGATRVVGRQPYAPAAFTPREIPGTHFQSLSRPQGTWFRRGEPRKKSSVTPPGIDPGTSRLVAQWISASSWFYYKEMCYDARSHERK